MHSSWESKVPGIAMLQNLSRNFPSEDFYGDASNINAEWLRNESTWKSQSVKIIQRKIIPIIEFSEVEGRNNFSPSFLFSSAFPCLCFIRKTAKNILFHPWRFFVSSSVHIWVNLVNLTLQPPPHYETLSSDDSECNKNIFASRKIAKLFMINSKGKSKQKTKGKLMIRCANKFEFVMEIWEEN